MSVLRQHPNVVNIRGFYQDADYFYVVQELCSGGELFDAIVSKRQYKSHVGITDTLKILIENSKPLEEIKKSDALTEIATNTKMGKNNPLITFFYLF